MQTTKQAVVQRFGLTSDRNTAQRPPAPVPSTKVNKAAFFESFLESIGVSSIFKLIRRDTFLNKYVSDLVLSSEENTVTQQW